MKECIFCKIIKKEIPNYTVYEDSQSLAFLDINPLSKGHTVVIPKVHAETLFDLNQELTKELMVSVQKTMETIEEKLHPDGYNVGWNHGESGGQAVPHLHIHIIPRFKNDGGGNIHSIIQNPGDLSVEEIAKFFI